MAKKPPLTLVPSTSSRNAPPRKLGAPGRELWDSITSEFDISDSGGIAVLMQACLAQDRVVQLADQIAIDGCVVYTKTGPKAHPALRDELAGRAFIVRTLQKLGVNIEAVRPQGRPPGWSPPTKA